MKIFSLTIFIGVVICQAALAQPMSVQTNLQQPTQQIPIKTIQKFATVIAQIKRFYIEPISDEKLFEHAIRGMISRLDPHSSYLDINDLKDLQTVTTGEFGGVGIEIIPKDGMIKVVSPLDDTPADKAGIKAGDLIVRINNKIVRDMTLRKAIEMMRGKKGSKVLLTILRKGEKEPLQFDIVRDIIKVQTVKSELLEPGYGYVRIAFFQSNAKPDLEKAVKKLKKKSDGQLKGLVLDLRNNPGGLLDAAIQVSDAFLDADLLPKENRSIVYTKGNIPDANIKADATAGELLKDTPVVVLINNGSASASEIVAGALKDHKRAIILGTKSFGKGSVQTVIPIDNESGLKLTTALYYTPKGTSIQAKGITPDVMVAAIEIPKTKQQDIVFDPIDEEDLMGHIDNGNRKKDKEPTLKEMGKSKPSQEKKSPKDKLSKKVDKEKKKLINRDFQLYEALTLLKGLNAIR